jgi:hypothetical protein
MKASYLIVALIFSFTIPLQSQTVDSIKVEQAGDKILVHYQILQSNDFQVFRVTLSCFLSTGIKLEPKSISGDFGENVTGGKAEYLIVWDVLKDLEELQSAEFSVKAELVKGLLTNDTKKGKAKNKFYIQILAERPPVLPGIRIGFSGAWGVSLMYCGGKDKNIDVPEEMMSKYVDHQSVDITKRVVNKDNFQLHIFGGFSSAQLRIYGTSIDKKSFFGIDGGLLMNIKKISMSFQISHFADNKDVTFGNKIDHFKMGIGLGVRF